MIVLTGKAAEFVKEIEEMEKESPCKQLELDENDQAALYSIMKLFQTDEAFKGYLSAILLIYANAHLNRTLDKLFALTHAVLNIMENAPSGRKDGN